MENAVDLVFTEAYLMPKKHYEFLVKVSMETEEGEPQKNQKTDIVKVAATSLFDESDFSDFPKTDIVKVAATSLFDESDFSDFPDLNQPLPEVSIREQLRLTSLNRGKVLSWQRGQHRHLVAMWHSRPTGDKIQE